MAEQVTVGVYIGCRRHRVAIAAPDGRIAEEFDMGHGKEAFGKLFDRLSHYRENYQVPVVVAMEGFNGYALPLDQQVREVPEGHQVLKRLTRRRRQLVQEKVCVLNRMQADLQALSPGLADLVEYKDGLAFLGFLTCRPRLEQLGKLRERSLLQITAVGKVFAEKVRKWQQAAFFSQEVLWGP